MMWSIEEMSLNHVEKYWLGKCFRSATGSESAISTVVGRIRDMGIGDKSEKTLCCMIAMAINRARGVSERVESAEPRRKV